LEPGGVRRSQEEPFGARRQEGSQMDLGIPMKPFDGALGATRVPWGLLGAPRDFYREPKEKSFEGALEATRDFGGPHGILGSQEEPGGARNSWLFLALPGSSWLLLAPPGSFWLLLELQMGHRRVTLKEPKKLVGSPGRS
jgi:hypothetical protein